MNRHTQMHTNAKLKSKSEMVALPCDWMRRKDETNEFNVYKRVMDAMTERMYAMDVQTKVERMKEKRYRRLLKITHANNAWKS